MVIYCNTLQLNSSNDFYHSFVSADTYVSCIKPLYLSFLHLHLIYRFNIRYSLTNCLLISIFVCCKWLFNDWVWVFSNNHSIFVKDDLQNSTIHEIPIYCIPFFFPLIINLIYSTYFWHSNILSLYAQFCYLFMSLKNIIVLIIVVNENFKLKICIYCVNFRR